MYWELAGNKVVTGMTAFLGTTSPHPLRIRTNTAVPTQPVGTQPKLDAQEAMRITPFQPGPTPQRGSVGIWTDAPRRALHVQGSEIHSGGAGAGFSFGNRETPDPFSVPVPNNGERWVWYASGGTARLWSLTDKIAVTPAGRVGIGTIAPGAILDISGSGGASQCCAPVVTTLSLAEASSAQNRQAWLQFHNGGEAEMYIRLAGGGPAGSGREGQRRLEIGDNQGANSSLRVNGDLNVTGVARKPGGGPWSDSSDVRLKKNVKPLKGALGKLLRLRGRRFEWKEPEKQGNLVGPQMGLVAQEVEEVFPEWVDTDSSGYKILTVRGFEALTVEAFKELKAENETLKMKNEELEDRIKVLELPMSERQPSGNRNGAVR